MDNVILSLLTGILERADDVVLFKGRTSYVLTEAPPELTANFVRQQMKNKLEQLKGSDGE